MCRARLAPDCPVSQDTADVGNGASDSLSSRQRAASTRSSVLHAASSSRAARATCASGPSRRRPACRARSSTTTSRRGRSLRAAFAYAENLAQRGAGGRARTLRPEPSGRERALSGRSTPSSRRHRRSGTRSGRASGTTRSCDRSSRSATGRGASASSGCSRKGGSDGSVPRRWIRPARLASRSSRGRPRLDPLPRAARPRCGAAPLLASCVERELAR